MLGNHVLFALFCRSNLGYCLILKVFGRIVLNATTLPNFLDTFQTKADPDVTGEFPAIDGETEDALVSDTDRAIVYLITVVVYTDRLAVGLGP